MKKILIILIGLFIVTTTIGQVIDFDNGNNLSSGDTLAIDISSISTLDTLTVQIAGSSSTDTADVNIATISTTDTLSAYITNLVISVVDSVTTDFTLGVGKTIEQSPITYQYTSGDNIPAQNFTAAWSDIGSEIDCRTYKTVGIYVNFVTNNSTTNEIQFLVKHEFGGGDEYVVPTASDYQKVIGDADIKVLYLFDVEAIPYLQIQIKTTVVGATAATATIDIIKEY